MLWNDPATGVMRHADAGYEIAHRLRPRARARPAGHPRVTQAGRPLDGVRVLDFTRVLAGPYCTALLADLGADVLKVEPPQGDDYRQIGPFRADGSSAIFAAVNRGKRSIVLDLATSAHREVALALAVAADVVVENFRPGVAAKLGIGAEALCAANPRLIYASISGFGQDGPNAQRTRLRHRGAGDERASWPPPAIRTGRRPCWARPSATWWPGCSAPGRSWPPSTSASAPDKAGNSTSPCSMR